VKPKGRANVDPAEHDRTRQRLLDAAGEMFARHGFEKATVRDICAACDANVAAVKYHFGDKHSLYRAAMDHWFQVAVQKYPLDLSRTGAPQERLHHFVGTLLLRMLGPGKPAWHGQLMAREIAEPTDFLDQMVQHTVKPMMAHLEAIVREIVGKPIPPARLRRLSHSVIGQIVFYKHSEPVLDRLKMGKPTSESDLHKLARHITAFSMGGIRAVADAEES
jgi:TetR/AcrR family transcriptional regulator, regulator of cefoperazone and chloramphenicol sensitivity